MTISTTTMVLLLLLQLRQPSALALGHNVTRAGIHIYDDDNDDDDNIIYTQTHFCAGEQLALRRARAVLDKTSRAAREGETEKERERQRSRVTHRRRALSQAQRRRRRRRSCLSLQPITAPRSSLGIFRAPARDDCCCCCVGQTAAAAGAH